MRTFIGGFWIKVSVYSSSVVARRKKKQKIRVSVYSVCLGNNRIRAFIRRIFVSVDA
jgi:hypothetical protein